MRNPITPQRHEHVKSLFGLKQSINLEKSLLVVFYNMDIDMKVRKYLILDIEERDLAWVLDGGRERIKASLPSFSP